MEERTGVIDKREILEAASALGLLPSVVEKDYVLGWILAGIHAHPVLSESWVFKGGTCLKKCYFETYRFSEDLDFTLRDESQLDAEFLKNTLTEVLAWVVDQSGLAMPGRPAGAFVTCTFNPRGRLNCQGKIGYRGPISPTTASGGWPKIGWIWAVDEQPVPPAAWRRSSIRTPTVPIRASGRTATPTRKPSGRSFER